MERDPSDEHAEMAKALRISQAQLSQILDIADDAIISIDSQRRITLFNQGAEKIFGYSSTEVMGRSLDILLPQKSTVNDPLHFSEFGQSAESVCKRSEIFGLRKDGSEFPAVASVSKLEIEGEGSFTIILRDITELKQMEAAVGEKELLLKELHHRVKNNLQIISSLLNLQSGYLTDERAIDIFKDCKNRVEAMALIHEQLYQSGSQSGVDLAKYIETLANDLFISYGVDTATINLNLDMPPIFVHIDTAIPCSLIINELVSNALKHAFRGREKGAISLVLSSIGGGKYLLIVRDNGVGMPDGLDPTKSDSLGLRLVNALTSQLKGSVEFKSNAGTEVWIYFTSSDYKEEI